MLGHGLLRSRPQDLRSRLGQATVRGRADNTGFAVVFQKTTPARPHVSTAKTSQNGARTAEIGLTSQGPLRAVAAERSSLCDLDRPYGSGVLRSVVAGRLDRAPPDRHARSTRVTLLVALARRPAHDLRFRKNRARGRRSDKTNRVMFFSGPVADSLAFPTLRDPPRKRPGLLFFEFLFSRHQ